MSITIEQLRHEASQIEEATRQGENTQLRVGGLFQDVIDFIAQIPITETVLGPLLQALNNSELLNPGDGQTLTFSIMKDGWTFSDAITQLQIKQNQISATVTSNYEEFLRVKDLLQAEVDATDQRVRNYKTDYDNSQIEYHTWQSQTDTSIGQFAAAFTVDGRMVSMSEMVQTAYDIEVSVTNNKEAADAAFSKLFNLTGLDYEDPEQAYTASWLYQNRQGIYGAAATFDEAGNILQSSKLSVTVAGINADISNVDGRCTSIQADINGLTTRVTNTEGTYSSIIQESTRLAGLITTLDGIVAGLEVTAVKKDSGGYITNAKLSADNIDFHFTEASTFYSGDDPVMVIDSNGNLSITGNFIGGNITGTVGIGAGTAKLYIQPYGTNGAELIGMRDGATLMQLGFYNEEVACLDLKTGSQRALLLPRSLTLEGYGNSVYLQVGGTDTRASFEAGDGIVQIGCSSNGKALLRSTEGWKSESEARSGEVYMDDSNILKVK